MKRIEEGMPNGLDCDPLPCQCGK